MGLQRYQGRDHWEGLSLPRGAKKVRKEFLNELKSLGQVSCSLVFTSSQTFLPPAAGLSVLKRCVPKTLAFAFGLRLRSKTRCFKTRVVGRRLPNGKPQERLRFRALRSKTLAFKKRSAIIFF